MRCSNLKSPVWKGEAAIYYRSVRSALRSAMEHGHWSVSTSGLGRRPYLTCVVDDCRISVEVAGPASPTTYTAKPDDIRGLADWLAIQCVIGNDGSGGFLTKDIGNMIDFITAPQTDIHGPYRRITRIPALFVQYRANIRTIKL